MGPSPSRPALPDGRAGRTGIILGISCGIAATVGVLTYLTSRSLPQSLLAAGSAADGATRFLSQVVDGTPDHTSIIQRGEQDANANDEQNL